MLLLQPCEAVILHLLGPLRGKGEVGGAGLRKALDVGAVPQKELQVLG